MANVLPHAYLNGRFLSLAAARISPLDRGFLFGDGVYEVIAVYAGRPFHLREHLARLAYSLENIRLGNPHSPAQWSALLAELVAKNGGGDQALYLQITRGADEGRDHAFPANLQPTVFAMCSPLAAPDAQWLARGARAATLEDIRWRRCDIKAVTLLGNILLRETARERGCEEAVLVRDGVATEGTASSLFMVHEGVLVTPPKSRDLLPSITRDVVLALARENGIACREAAIPLAQLQQAEEIWLASTTREVYPVTELDGRPVGSGRPGARWQAMYALFQRHKLEHRG